MNNEMANNESKNGKKDWTFLIFLAGDNNLNDEMIRSIEEIIKGVSPDPITPSTDKSKIGIVVQFDGEHPAMPTVRRDLTFGPKFEMTSAEQIKIPEPTGTSPSNSSNAHQIENDLNDFIIWGATRHPANNYALILSGHSDAFLGKTLLLNESPSGVATLTGLRQMFEDLFEDCKDLFPKGKFDIIGFDGCVMNSLEVIHEFKHIADLWIGSEGSIPNYTWDYQEIFRHIVGHPSLTKEKIAKFILDKTKDFNAKYAFGGRSTDLSVCDLHKVSDLTQTLDRNAIFLFHLLLLAAEPETRLGRKIRQLILQAHWNSQTYMYNQTTDLRDLCQRLRTECVFVIQEKHTNDNEEFAENYLLTEQDEKEILEIIVNKILKDGNDFFSNIDIKIIAYLIYRQCGLIIDKVNAVVNESTVTTGPDYQFSKGISLFFPWSLLGFKMILREYGKLKFYCDCRGWVLFAALYVTITARPRPEIVVAELLKPLPENYWLKLISETILTTTVSTDTIEPLKTKISEADTTPIDINVALETVINLILSKSGDTKDNQPRTRGIDKIVNYFARTDNFFPKLDVRK